MEFRRKAVKRLEEPEELDMPIRLATSRGWIGLAAVALAMAVGLVWACVASLARVTHAEGILTNPKGSFPVQSTVAGEIIRLTDALQVGATIQAGSAVAEVMTNDRGPVFVNAGVSGRVTAVYARPGQVIGTGTTLVMTEPNDGAGLAAVLYVPSPNAVGLRVGENADLTALSTPQLGGRLRGTVESVGAESESRQQIAAFLGDGDLAVRFTQGVSPVKVVVRLAGGGTSLPPRTLLAATIRIGSIRPIELVRSR
jgi:biotin carboxyl carrier protein